MSKDELTPAQAEAVRRLLAEARHDQPMPDAVTGRLDDVIAELGAERAALDENRGGTVVPLHRRRWPKVLVAAAAVSAIGLGITQVVGGVGGGGADSGAADGDTSLLDSGQRRAASEEEDDGIGVEFGDGREPTPLSGDVPASVRDSQELSKWMNRHLEVNGVSVESFSMLTARVGGLRPLDRGRMRITLRELGAALDESASKHAEYDLIAGSLVNTPAAYDLAIAPRECGPIYTVVGGTATYAKYHKKLALVLFHPKINGAQLVELYVCSGKAPRRSVERVTLWDGE